MKQLRVLQHSLLTSGAAEALQQDPLCAELYRFVTTAGFKRLMNQIVAEQLRLDFRSLSFISAEQGEGKSFLTACVALGYCFHLRTRVLIVDAASELGSPGNQFFQALQGTHAHGPSLDGQERGPGSIDLLVPNQVSEPDNPFDLVNRNDFELGSYLHSLKSHFDLILLDLPAMSETSGQNFDPVVVSRYVDCSVLVTSMASYDRVVVKRMKRALQRYNLNVIGTVFNQGGRRG